MNGVVSSVLSPEEIKRVKGLGCLRDKRYPDVFNVRVITRNGKITTHEHQAIAEAADPREILHRLPWRYPAP